MTYGQLAAAVNEAMRPAAPAPAQTRSLAQVTDALIAQQTLGASPAHAMSLPSLHAVIRLIASSVDQLDIVADPGELPPWLAQPRRTGAALDLGDLIQHTITTMALVGHAELLATKDPLGWRLSATRPGAVQIQETNTGEVGLDFWYEGQPIQQIGPRGPGDSDRYVVHIPYLVTPDKIAGTSPAVDAWPSLAGYLAVERQAANLLDSGTYSGGRLETDHEITADAAKRYREQWVLNRETGQIPVLGAGIRYVNDAIDPVKAQYLESRMANAQAVASMYGVPPDMLGMTMAGGNSSLAYANAQDNLRRFRLNCLELFTSQIEDALSPLLAPRQTIRFDYTEWETNGAHTEPAAVPVDDPGL